jgi:hypothetical protein
VLNFAGETALIGFVGTEAEFQRQSGGLCAACVDDAYYDGTAQLTVESSFVCEIETTGFISGQTNFNISAFIPGYVAAGSGSFLDVVVYAETTPFPKKGFPYDVRVANNDGLEEVPPALRLIIASYLFIHGIYFIVTVYTSVSPTATGSKRCR